MTPAEWVKALPDVSTRTARATVATEAKRIITLANEEIGTADLVELMFPLKHVVGEQGTRARQAIFKLLEKASKHELEGWWRHVPARANRFGAIVRPKVWKAPAAQGTSVTCPHCGKEIW